MNTVRKRNLLLAGGVASLFIIAAIIALFFFNINTYKSRIETAASQTTGLDISIKGKLVLFFFPFALSARDIHVAKNGSEILSLETIKLRVELLSLLREQLKITSCEFVKPALTLVKDAEGIYNFEGHEKISKEGRPVSAFNLPELKLSQGMFVYLNKKTGERTEFQNVNLDIKDLLVTDTAPGILKNISFTGNIFCKEVRKKDLQIANVKSTIKAQRGVIHFLPLTMDIFGARGVGDATADKSQVDSVYKINLQISKLDFAKLEKAFGTQKAISGWGDLSASLTMKEKGNQNLLSGIDGTFSLRGDNLVVYTMDMDKIISSYETSQKFNLVDLGAFFIAGPLSVVVLKGYRYGNLYYQSRGGQSAVNQFISHWQIKEGMAEAIDCALATQHNRVALKGRLNLVSGQYDKVIVAILDDKGCAKFEQSISGSFGSPQVDAVSAIESLGGPIYHLYRKAKRIVQSGNCDVFYNGSVRQPG